MKEHEMEVERISDLIRFNWGIRPQKINFIEEGDSTNNWRVISDDGETYVLRNAGSYRHYVRFQCDVLNYLTENGFPYQIPTPIKTMKDNFFIGYREDSLFLYRYIPGDVLGRVTHSDAFEIGKMLAVYHKYVSSFDWQGYDQLRSKDLFEEGKMVEFISKCRSEVMEKTNKTKIDQLYLSKIQGFSDFYSSIVAHVDLGLHKSLKRIPCHGDFERRNIIKREGKIVGFIDLGGITIDPQIYDLQNCVQLNSMRKGKLDMDVAKVIIDGYGGHAKSEREQFELILPLMYSEMLKTLCWVIAERSKSGTRVDESEAAERVKVLSWMLDNYSSLEKFFRNLES